MKKEGFRLPVLHQPYDPNGAVGLRNDLECAVVKLLPVKSLREAIKDATESCTRTADAEQAAQDAAANAADAAARAGHDVAQQLMTAQANAAGAAWDQLAHAAQVHAGARPPAHVVVVYAPQVPIHLPGARDNRISTLRDALVADQLVLLFSAGASLADLYESSPTALASVKVAKGHGEALRAVEGALCTALHSRTAVQAHPLATTIIVDAILEHWRSTVQGYTADQLASANIAAVESILVRQITLAATHDTVQQHCDAFAAVNGAAIPGFEDRLVSSVMRTCEPSLRSHLNQTVSHDDMVRQAKAGMTAFVRFLVSHSQLALAKCAADVATRTAASSLAALEVLIAGLRADQGRLELRLREQGQGERTQRDRGGQRQQQQRGRQVVGSPDYTGCNFVLPSGALCGNPGHARIDHPG